MRNVIIVPIYLLFFAALSFSVAAQDAEPLLLKEPADWRFERIDFPLAFAPELDYAGFEELRFAPGMFDTLATDYFTYVFYITVDKKYIFTKKELKNFLLKYYRGLSAAVAEDKEMTIDVNEIKVRLKKVGKVSSSLHLYDAKLKFIDTFTNGQMVDLNMELDIKYSPYFKQYCIFAKVSPLPKSAEIWQTFDELEKTLFRRK